MTQHRLVALVSLSIGDIVRGAESSLPRANLGLLSLQVALEQNNIQSLLLDGDDSNLDDAVILKRLLAAQLLIAGFTLSQVNAERTIAVIRHFREQAPQTPIVIGGHHASIVATDLLNDVPEVDCVVVGDGEEPLLQLAQMASTPAGLQFDKVAGVAFRTENKVLINSPIAIQDPDKFPRIAQAQVGRNCDIAIMASRGCAANCTFCASPCFARVSQSKRWRPRSPEDVVDELEKLVRQKSERIFRIHFHDADFVGRGSKAIERAKKIADMIIEKGLMAEFRFACRADTAVAAGRKFWDAWKRAGLVKVYLGLESGLDWELELYHKGTTVQDNMQSCKLVRASGLSVQIGYITFHPHSTHESILRNVQFLQHIQQGHLYGLIASSLVVYPGTGLFERLSKEGLLCFKRVYLPIGVEFSSEDVSKIRDVLFSFRKNQYTQDRLCLDFEFGISANRDTIEFDGFAVSTNSGVIERYAIYRTQRSSCLQSSVERILQSSADESQKLASRMDEQLTCMHKQFVRMLFRDKEI